MSLKTRPNSVLAEASGTMGCEVNPVELGCITCHLPRCRYDVPDGVYRKWRRQQADFVVAKQVKDLVDEGWMPHRAIKEIVGKTGINIRTIYRILRRVRAEAV
jgi:hypothetical protein